MKHHGPVGARTDSGTGTSNAALQEQNRGHAIHRSSCDRQRNTTLRCARLTYVHAFLRPEEGSMLGSALVGCK